MKTEIVTIPGAHGHDLAGRLELPAGPVAGYALFAHCFTCGKDSAAAVKVSRALAARGVATLRIDFAGIGQSGGAFTDTTFSSNVDDLVVAADYLRAHAKPPSILIGHSLGGAAVLAAGERIPEAVAVATIGAPFDVAHIERQFAEAVAAIEEAGAADVKLGGRNLTIGRALVEDVRRQPQGERIARLRKALLVLHAPTDAVVGIENAQEIFFAAKHPKSYVSLDDADHFLSRAKDAEYAAAIIAAWAARYMHLATPSSTTAPPEGTVIVQETGAGHYQNRAQIGDFSFLVGEPARFGGDASGPNPYELLAASLAACKSVTMRMYAERKAWPLAQARVTVRHEKVHAADCADCETKTGLIDEFQTEIALEGPLDEEQRARLLEIAEKCPVHRTLTGTVKIRSHLAPT